MREWQLTPRLLPFRWVRAAPGSGHSFIGWCNQEGCHARPVAVSSEDPDPVISAKEACAGESLMNHVLAL